MSIVNEKAKLRTWIEIDRDHLRYNYHMFRDLLADSCLLAAVTKSNAYGHSLVDYSLELSRLGADYLMVDSIIEAVKLRQAGLTKPILVLGYTLPSVLALAVAHQVSLTISSFEALSALRQLSDQDLSIHLKFDTGMCRQGFFPADLNKVLDFLADELPQVKVQGVFTHLAAAKNPAFADDTEQQLAKFAIITAEFARRGLSVIRHAAASAGTLIYPQSHLDMVRVGIGLYGLWPSLQVESAMNDHLTLRPILSWKTVISEIKSVPAGSRVGYDFTERLERDSVIGILPVGYWHGYDRSLSSIGRVLVNGQYARVLGRVSMDMLIIDLTRVSHSAVGDEVVLIGTQGTRCIGATDLADRAETSAYEIITRLNPLIKRFYI
jgi:alanine racemase